MSLRECGPTAVTLHSFQNTARKKLPRECFGYSGKNLMFSVLYDLQKKKKKETPRINHLSSEWIWSTKADFSGLTEGAMLSHSSFTC